MSSSSSGFMVGALLVAMLLAGCGRESSPAEQQAPEKGSSPKAQLILTKERVDWCGEHGVPESECTRCNSDLIAGFKEKGDWCDQHGLPKSQCVACDPSVEAKWKAKAPKK